MLDFHDMYEEFAADVYRFSIWVCGNGQDAEDITSETFIRAWSKRHSIRTETLKAYLFAIARNIYLESKRNQKNPSRLNGDISDPSPGPEKTIELKSDLQQAHKVLMTLSEIDRTAFILRVQHNIPYAEISRILNLSLSTSKVKVHRARKKIIQSFLEKE